MSSETAEGYTLLLVLNEDSQHMISERTARSRLPSAQTCPACGKWHLEEEPYCVDASEECLVDKMVHNNAELGPLSSGREIRYSDHLKALVIRWEGETIQDGIWALQATLPWAYLNTLTLLPVYSYWQALTVAEWAEAEGIGKVLVLPKDPS